MIRSVGAVCGFMLVSAVAAGAQQGAAPRLSGGATQVRDTSAVTSTVVFDSSALDECASAGKAGLTVRSQPSLVERCQLRAELLTRDSEYNTWALTYSVLYQGLLAVSVGLSALATFWAGKGAKDGTTPDPRRVTNAAFVAFLAALLTAVNTSLAFGAKWRINRDSRTETELIQLATRDPHVPLPVIRARLEKVIKNQSEGISSAGVGK
jgi:hypothetical protein